ncbi:hypothetical protein BOX15_Mlig000922g5 [Macrostomum lignano]|uniref:Uncharacterized protein n=1 Tax=Macrostomum lignano TaxID=282301 RepID=A0A267FQC6_9PLAT|nr:hypothetical protein BOX15_Mlig000922g5 [Macrostomum lignano]
MSSKRLSKRRDSRQVYLSVREKGSRFHSDNNLTDLKEFHNKAAAAAAAAAAATAAPDRANPSPSREAANLNGFRVGGPAEFGSSSSVQTAPAGVGAVSRDRADSLELSAGGGARSGSPQIRSKKPAGRDLHPIGIAAAPAASAEPASAQQRRRSSGGPLNLLFGSRRGSSELLSGSRGSAASKESGYLTVHSGSRMMLALSQKMQDPAERARMQQRYLELRELLAELREQKSAKEAQLQALLARERELTGKQMQQTQHLQQQPQRQQQQQQQQQQRLRPGGLGSTLCLPTQFLVAVDTDAIGTDTDSVLSVELESVKQEISVQKAMVDAHVRLLREAKATRQPRHVKKQRAADYQLALEKLSQLNLRARYIRDQMSSADWFDEDTLSHSSSFAYINGAGAGAGFTSQGGPDTCSVAGSVSSAYHSGSPRNTSSTDYCSESLLSGQVYDARSLVSDLSRESSVRSAASANAPSVSSCILGSHQNQPQQHRQQQQQQQQLQPPPIVPRRSNLGPNARAGSKWRRSNSMGNLLAEADAASAIQSADTAAAAVYAANQRQQQRRLPATPTVTKPVNTNFPIPVQSQPPAPYRRGSNASVGGNSIGGSSVGGGSVGGVSASLSASQQSPYWYTPRSNLEPSHPVPQQRRPLKQHSDL